MFENVIATLGGPTGIFILGGFYVSIIIGERLFAWATARQYDDGDARCSVALNLINSSINLVVSLLLPLAIYVVVFENYRLTTINTLWLSVPLAFVVHELSYYWEHRLSHRVGLLWAFHAIHHSSNHFNHTTAARGFYFDGMLQTFFALGAALMGVPPAVYIAVAILKSAYGIWNHASYVGDLGWMERWFATPRNHMVHHANQPQYIDRNYSQVLIIWDRLFGSFAKYEEPPVVGLVNQVYDNNPLTAQFAGITQLRQRMAAADRLSDKLAYLWRPPEWSHDGVCRSDCPKYAGQSAIPATKA